MCMVATVDCERHHEREAVASDGAHVGSVQARGRQVEPRLVVTDFDQPVDARPAPGRTACVVEAIEGGDESGEISTIVRTIEETS